MPIKLAVSGVFGNLGRALVQGLHEEVEILGLDSRAMPTFASPRERSAFQAIYFRHIEIGNASVVADSLAGFGCNAFVHFAGYSLVDASREQAEGNVRLTEASLDAVEMAGVPQFVCLSSNHTTAGYEQTSLRPLIMGDYSGIGTGEVKRLTTADMPWPVSYYGFANVAKEFICRSRALKAAANERPFAVAVLRLGTSKVNEDGEDRGPDDLRQFATYMTRADFLRLMRGLLTVGATIPWVHTYAVSDNPGRPWEMELPAQLLPFTPQESTVRLWPERFEKFVGTRA